MNAACLKKEVNVTATKDRICDAAIKLFNEQGFEGVSLRDIAAEAGVAIGTLTYHFPKKEDLVIVLLKDLHAYMPQVNVRSAAVDAGIKACLAGMLEVLRRSEEHQEKYRYYFENIPLLVQDSPELFDEDMGFEKSLFDYYHDELRYLRDKDALREGFSEDDLKRFAIVLVNSHFSWLLNASPYRNDRLPRIGIAEALAGLIRGILRPSFDELFAQVLSEKGIHSA